MFIQCSSVPSLTFLNRRTLNMTVNSTRPKHFVLLVALTTSLGLFVLLSTSSKANTRKSPTPIPSPFTYKLKKLTVTSVLNYKRDNVTGKRPQFNFTYSDPMKYKGPVVQGWPPSSNRALNLYVRPDLDTFPIVPSKKLLDNSQLLVVVHSAPDFFEARMGVRNSYGQYVSKKQAGNTSIVFLIGKTDKYPQLVRDKVEKEQLFHQDLLQADMVDSYNNLTLKTLFTLKYFLNTSNFESQPKYLAKLDSDSYLNLPGLWRILFQNTKWSQVQDLLMGALFAHPRPFKISVKDRGKKYTAKYVCPSYMYNGTRYPPILSGSGYVMSRSAAECLYREALELPFFHLEDVLVTGFAADQCGIERRNHNGFRPAPIKRQKIKPSDILLHYLDFKAKMNIYKDVHLHDQPV